MSTVTISPAEESGRTRGVWIAVGDYLSALLQTLTEKPARFSKLGPGILLLTLIAAIRMYSTWATWGDLSIDAGHETYVPAVLAEGKMLYRDVWYHYGPAAPYFNSYLFRIFGVHLSVLYFAGAFAALGSGVFLFLSGTELGFSLAGWTAGAVVLVEAFEPGLFSFPLPYSFASVYGCLAVSVLLWVLLRSLKSASVIWILTAGGLASLALLLKLEYGVASYAGFWVRDFQYMIEGYPAGIPLDEIRRGFEYLIARQRADGAMPNKVQRDGTPVYCPMCLSSTRRGLRRRGDKGGVGRPSSVYCSLSETSGSTRMAFAAGTTHAASATAARMANVSRSTGATPNSSDWIKPVTA